MFMFIILMSGQAILFTATNIVRAESALQHPGGVSVPDVPLQLSMELVPSVTLVAHEPLKKREHYFDDLCYLDTYFLYT